MTRLWSVFLVAMLLIGLGAIRSSVLAATGPCPVGHHYASEEVVVGAGGLYNPPTCGGDPYFGWIGIDGQITYPSQYPLLGSTQNFSAGWIGINFGDGGWVQEGWFEGCVGGHCLTRNLGRYTEVQLGSGCLYNCYQFVAYDAAPLGGSSIFLIEYAGIIYPDQGPCWNLYFDYTVEKQTYCSLQGSGQPMAASEIYTYNGNSVGMPQTVYGYSNPNTNNALRIKGANGFVPWTGTLSSGQTGYYDERYGQPGCSQPGNPACLYYNFAVINYNYNYQVSAQGQQ